MQPFLAVANLFSGIKFRFTVLMALMIREVHTRFGREYAGALWLVLEPFIFTVLVTMLWIAVKPPYENGVPIVAFVITGYAPLIMWRHSANRSVNSLRANASLLYHRQIGLMDILLSRILLEVYGTIISFFIIILIFYSLDLYSFPVNYSAFYLGWGYIILFSIGTSLIMACLSEKYEWMEKVTSPATYIMVPVSGAFFMVDWLPASAHKIALLLPSVHGFELIRLGQFGDTVIAHYDHQYVLLVCFGMIFLGLVLTTKVRKYIELE